MIILMQSSIWITSTMMQRALNTKEHWILSYPRLHHCILFLFFLRKQNPEYGHISIMGSV